MSDKSNEVVDNSGDRKYFTMIPNMLDDLMDLSVYGFRLYYHLKRVAGDKGKCWQSTKNLAYWCNMSVGAVVRAKKELERLRLITITKKQSPHGGFDYHEITINDIWKENINEYESRKFAR
jgi:hypothetical protein